MGIKMSQTININFQPLAICNPVFQENAPKSLHVMPQVCYKVQDKDDVFQYNSTAKKVARIAWLIFSIVVFPLILVRLIGRTINYLSTKYLLVPGVNNTKHALDAIRKNALKNPLDANKCERLAIETADHVKLDTMMIKNPNQENKAVGDRKYIIFFNGNNATYEEMLPTLLKISQETNTHILCGNYRGVGYSEGFPEGVKDLVMDGEAMVHYLLSQGVKAKNILIHGWSLGGGVGAHVAALHQKKNQEGRATVLHEDHVMNFVNDRSFSSMAEEAKELLGSIRKELNRGCLARLFAIGLAILTPFAILAIRALGWNFKSFDCYKKIQGAKFIIYHSDDSIIPKKASLHRRVKKSLMTAVERQKKIERQILKKRLKAEGKVYHPKKKKYPAYVVRLRRENDRENDVHGIPIVERPEFKEYKRQVAKALAII